MRRFGWMWMVPAAALLAWGCGGLGSGPASSNGKADGVPPPGIYDFGDGDDTAGPPIYGQGRLAQAEGRAVSAIAHFFDFTFDGELVADSWEAQWGADRVIQRQLFYTVGQLNGDNSVGRMDQIVLTNVVTEPYTAPGETEPDESKLLVRYTATLLVAWAKRNYEESGPAGGQYTFKLPFDMTSAGEEAFVAKYDHSCVDWGAHDIDTGSMWYYYRPNRSGCGIVEWAEGDGGETKPSVATATASTQETEGKYPEYDRVWKDGALNVVAVFGKVDEGGDNGDQGVTGYNSFVKKMKSLLGDYNLTTVPDSVSDHPGIEIPDVTLIGTLPDGKTIRVDAMVIDSVTDPGRTGFYDNYGELTKTADLIAYSGHSGLGQNIRKMASKGQWVAGQYAMVYLNGCDSFAYVDEALNKAHRCTDATACDPIDPVGTRYLDTLVNAMPSYFSNMDESIEVLTKGLLAYAENGTAKTYEDLLRKIPSSQVVLVLGEHDNAFGVEQPEPEDNVCKDHCGSQHPTLQCYCDQACAQVGNGDCCQADGSAGADKGNVEAACGFWTE